jgi:hypothetical protein
MGALADEVGQAFFSVLRCPNVRQCIETPRREHPCQEIVNYQLSLTGAQTYDEFQLPEPWCGQIDIAPILFISSNPSIGDDQRALGNCLDEDAFDSHHYVFGGGNRTYTADGVYTLDTAGLRSRRPVTYWSRARDRAQELIPDREVVWGSDYALTEIVRCKSKHEEGVLAALEECTARHFDRTMSVAAARVILAIGKARNLVRTRFAIPDDEMLAERIIAGRSRLIAFLPHPSGWEPGPRSLSGLYTNDQLERMRELAKYSRRTAAGLMTSAVPRLRACGASLGMTKGDARR